MTKRIYALIATLVALAAVVVSTASGTNPHTGALLAYANVQDGVVVASSGVTLTPSLAATVTNTSGTSNIAAGQYTCAALDATPVTASDGITATLIAINGQGTEFQFLFDGGSDGNGNTYSNGVCPGAEALVNVTLESGNGTLADYQFFG